MAHGGMVLDKDQFNCAMCQDVLKDPVTIPCGHSYCSECISSYWDDNSNLKVFNCPQCRQTFNPRPVLGRSILLDDVVGIFKQSGLQEASAGRTLAEEDDVECNVCPKRKYKAVRSCLVCLASFCELHIQPHYQSNELKTHTLITASKRVQECVCGQHNRLLEFYCRTYKQCICLLCVIDQHKGHDVVMAEVERQEQQNQLGKMKHDCQENIQQAEKMAEKVKENLSSVKDYAWKLTKTSEELIKKMTSYLEEKHFGLIERIHNMEKLEVSEVEQSLEEADIVIKEQQRMWVELDKLAENVNPVHFLQKLPSLKAWTMSSLLPDFNLILFKDIYVYQEWMLEYYKEGFNDIFEEVEMALLSSCSTSHRLTPAPPAQAEAAPSACVTPPVQREAAASKRVQECVCGQHNRLLEIYCRTDKQCICLLCVIDQHKGHDVVMAEVERQEQQNQLGKMKHDCQENIQQAEKMVEKVKANLSSFKDCAWQLTKMSEELIKKMTSSLEEKHFGLIERIHNMEKLEKLPSLKAWTMSSLLPDFNLILFKDIYVYQEWMLEYYKEGFNDIFEEVEMALLSSCSTSHHLTPAPPAQAEAAPSACVTPPVQREAAGEDLLPEPEVTQGIPPESRKC
nr:E3 ubiquitin-protein ligase TRIM8-like isoform X3 [Nerophis lumbriciformis]